MYLVLVMSFALAAHALPAAQEHLHFAGNMEGLIVYLINHLRERTTPPASSMAPISWADDLEDYAAEWATCGENYFTKRTGSNYGETLSISGSENDVFSDGIDAAIASAVDAWWNERKKYSYRDSSCSSGSCQSYLQLASEHTTTVGCAYALNCRDSTHVDSSWTYNMYIVCYFNPKGVSIGVPPYERIPNSDVRTRGGTANGLSCVFPFRYKGQMHSSCIKSADTDTPWCRAEDGNWGYCMAPGAGECSDKRGDCFVYNYMKYFSPECPAESSLPDTEVVLKTECRSFCKYCSCDAVCKNGGLQKMDCGCMCQGNWAGDDCSFCPIRSCKNGGVLDAANCQCNCAPGFGGVECDCKDNPNHWLNHGASWICSWDWIVTNGLCSCNYYGPAIVNNCPGRCNACIHPLKLLREY